ncbi:MAG: DUF58 domain-containing protein, partial [Planctomycetota bacterium]|nr:DUF58 domain-containing protein [Planctomycetota bacterium]
DGRGTVGYLSIPQASRNVVPGEVRFSVEFRQHRPYVVGDEIRRLDWKVFGKTDRFYIREYEDETNLRAAILLDASGSMAYGSAGVSKYRYAVKLAACLAYLLIQQTDAVGLTIFDRDIREHIPARSRACHLRPLLDTLAQSQPGGETAIADVLHALVPKLPRRSMIAMISDCFDDTSRLLAALAHLRHAHHEVLVFQIWDRAELEFPFTQWTKFESLEQDEDKRLVDPAHLRRAYLARLAQFRQELQDGCRRHRIDLISLVTESAPGAALAAYLGMRRRYR